MKIIESKAKWYIDDSHEIDNRIYHIVYVYKKIFWWFYKFCGIVKISELNTCKLPQETIALLESKFGR